MTLLMAAAPDDEEGASSTRGRRLEKDEGARRAKAAHRSARSKVMRLAKSNTKRSSKKIK